MSTSRIPPYLPAEILMEIFSYFDPLNIEDRPALHACARASRAWNEASIAKLYEGPSIDTQQGLERFAAALHSSDLGKFVRQLDFWGVQSFSDIAAHCTTILQATRENVKDITAPACELPYPVLSQCRQLRRLSLDSFEGAVSIRLLFKAISQLDTLKALSFRHIYYDLSAEAPQHVRKTWLGPQNLLHLRITGEIKPTAISYFQVSNPIKTLQVDSYRGLSSIFSDEEFWQHSNFEWMEILVRFHLTPWERMKLEARDRFATLTRLKIPCSPLLNALLRIWMSRPDPHPLESLHVYNNAFDQLFRRHRPYTLNLDMVYTLLLGRGLGNLRELYILEGVPFEDPDSAWWYVDKIGALLAEWESDRVVYSGGTYTERGAGIFFIEEPHLLPGTPAV